MKFTFAPESRPLEGYTIKRAIYRGGFGEVYYALTDAGREVALKLLQHNTDVELRGVQQCLNLSHPNLVTIFDIRQDGDGDHWILMEYVAGETLDATLRRYPDGMPMEEIRRWLPGLAAGVMFLHDRGIVHRDLKPGNVFIESGVVKVGDVGLSKFIAPSKRSAHTQSVGTVYYMAPEVAKGKYGKQVDVYAIGIMLYEMLTGRVPFDGESTGEILMKHLSESADLSVLPPRLRPVIARALEKDPARRFPSVAALAAAFELAVLGKSVALEIPEASFVGRDKTAGHEPHKPAARHGKEPNRYAWRYGERFHGTSPWLVFGLFGLLISAFAGVPQLGIASLCAVFYGAHRSIRGGSTRSWAQHQRGHVVEPPVPERQAAPTSSNEFALHVAYEKSQQKPGERPWKPDCLKKRAVLTPRTPRGIPLHDRANHFFGSASLAAIFTAVFTTCIAIFAPEFFGAHGAGGSLDPALIGLFSGTALSASWCLLGVTKLLEGRKLDFGMRRVIQLLMGLVVGEIAWGLSQLLYVEIPDTREAPFRSINSQPLMTEIGPTWLGYMVFFGLLFALRRWWWHTDSFRPKRFRIMSVLLTMLVAAGLMFTFEFALGWGLVWAAVISSVVQLSAPWTPPATRVAKS